MQKLLLVAASLAWAGAAWAAEPKVLVEGLKNPESVTVAENGRIYVSVIGEFDKEGDGSIVAIETGKPVTVVPDLDDPKGIAAHKDWLYVADRNHVVRIDTRNNRAVKFAPTNAFPVEPKFLNDVVVDPESGMVYVSDSGDLEGNGGAVYRITPNGLVSLVLDKSRFPELHTPNGLAMDGASSLLMLDFGTGKLYRIRLSDSNVELVAEGFGKADGLAWDHIGRLYISDWGDGQLFVIPKPGEKPIKISDKFESAADITYYGKENQILVPDMATGKILAVQAEVPGQDVDTSPLAIETVPAFPDLKWTDWEAETDEGKLNSHRPILLTHAGDGSNRNFVPTQQGVIHVFPNDPKAKETKVFLDLSAKVQYDDKTNEEGLLGLAFHPNYKETGEFFVFYTLKDTPRTNVVSRFRVSKSDPDQADPNSEEEVIRFRDKPFWNHDGGTILFGPDGMLYITHGDGGFGGDPKDHGQRLDVWFGKILRIDINRKEGNNNYGIPPDNPFVGVENAKPEIWAYGLRNVWRMAFDRETGTLWAGDVGQNLFEEINLITKGGNYGWNRREGFHPFGARGVGVNDKMIDPIWEYNHDVGRSITGGGVYRGSKIPELKGHYIYADYVTTKIWALKYDGEKGRVVANRTIPDRKRPPISFGEDEKGEFYLMSVSTDGKGIFTFAKTK